MEPVAVWSSCKNTSVNPELHSMQFEYVQHFSNVHNVNAGSTMQPNPKPNPYDLLFDNDKITIIK